jgi:hypothetical protein
MRDDSVRPDRRCVHCGVALLGFEDDSPGGAVAPPIDVVARLQALGLGKSPGDLVDPESIREEDVLIEPRMITGDGAHGPVWGRGRSWRGDGALSTRDKNRLVFDCLKVRDGVS